jgi:hypothetical protein
MSPVGVTPVAVVAHLMLDSVVWVDGRHQDVLVRPPRATLTSRGCGATRCGGDHKIGSADDCMGRG